MKPLDGIRVLDLSRVLAGPWATQLLADLGAQVIKVEKPGQGDDTRAWGPPWHEGLGGARVSAYFLSANRGKRSIAIDIAKPRGAALVRRLAAKSDVMVENYKVCALARYGLDAAALRRADPRLIVASITGFGQDGPYAARAGYDFMIQAMGGMMSITGRPDGEPGGGPLRAGVAIADLFTGMYAATAILAALQGRERTGEGAHIDLALLDVQVAVLANQAMNYLVGGSNPPRQGNTHPNIVPYQSFAVADGEVVVAVGNDAQFTRFAQIAGHPEWSADPRFATNAARVANRSALIPLIAPAMLERSASDWLHAFEKAGVPAGPINDLRSVFQDPQIRHRGMRSALVSGAFGELPSVGSPIRIDGGRNDSPSAPPALGEHTWEILAELGIERAEIDQLSAERIVAQFSESSPSL